MSDRMEAPDSGVRVRMYRPGGLGDCFLLAFPGTGGEARYLLVDCGVFFGTRGGAARMRAIAADIAQATDGRLDVLVATHEHWDHLCGLTYARETFAELAIGEVWLAWTEDPAHPVARRLRERRHHALRALAATAHGLRASGEGAELGAEMADLLAFHGDLGATSTADLMERVRGMGKPRFCRPGGAPLALPGVAGTKVWVLGPPEDETALSRSDPSGDPGEVYGFAPLTEGQALQLAARTAWGEEAWPPPPAEVPEDEELPEDAGSRALWSERLGFDPGAGGGADLTCPFGRHDGIPLAEVAADPGEHGLFFWKRYGSDEGKPPKALRKLEREKRGDEGAELGIGPAWRRVDHDWARALAHLALALDGDTNNTSLVLAFELPRSGRVLLFPADAQVGNWLSWDGVELDGGDPARPLTAEELLRRTVLYKVGHHGSHNATLQERGLERMESEELVAMIPVDEEQARAKEWKMPFGKLLERLHEKTRGRVLRSDRGLPEGHEELDWGDFEVEEAELWVQVTIPDSAPG